MKHSVTGTVEIFPQQGGWVFVRVPQKYSRMYADIARAERGLIAIVAQVGNTSWKTSLLPMGDGSHFIALPAKVRTKEGIEVGKKIGIDFEVRER